MKKILALAGLLAILAGCTTTTNNYLPPSGEPIPSATPPVTSSPTPPAATPPPTTVAAATQTYNNSAYNFQFDYPTAFTFTDANYANLENKIVQVQIPSSTYPKTNFGDAAFTVSESAPKTLADCLTINAPEGGTAFTDSTTINGIKFYSTRGQGAGAGNFYATKIYRTFLSPQCFEIVETVHTGNIGNYEPGTVTEVDQKPIWADLDTILATFKFTNKT